MADFSPTGYWAWYSDGEGVYDFPVVGHGTDAMNIAKAQVYEGTGVLTFVDEIDDLEFLGVFTSPHGA